MIAIHLLWFGVSLSDWRQSPIRTQWRTMPCDAGRSIISGTSRVMTDQELTGAAPLSQNGTRSFSIR